MLICVHMCVYLCPHRCVHTCLHMFNRAKGQQKMNTNKRHWWGNNERKKNSTSQKQLVPFSVSQTALIIEVSQASPTIFSQLSLVTFTLPQLLNAERLTTVCFLDTKNVLFSPSDSVLLLRQATAPRPVSSQSPCEGRSTIAGYIQKTRESKSFGKCGMIIIIFPVVTLSFLMFCLG